MLKSAIRKVLEWQGLRLSNLNLIAPALRNEENLLKVTFDSIVSQHLLETADFFFIQVGAFDGLTLDPIRKFILRYGWKGVLLEPQKNAFEKLKWNYQDQPQLVFKNVAIANQRTTRTLFTVGGSDLPEWCQSVASFDREVIRKHSLLEPRIDTLIEANEVECVTFSDLIEELGLSKLDLLQIDAEGYDAELVKMFPFHLLRPHIIHFERKHLLRDEMEGALEVLIANGYKFANAGNEDLVACLRG